MTRLHRDMTREAFDNGYFYAADLKIFAREIGITVGNFRKIELEELVCEFLQTGRVPTQKPVMPRKAGAQRDELAAENTVTNYVGDKRTKALLLELVSAQAPSIKTKSGQWYWLNDWRRKKQQDRAQFTYQDLADHLLALMQTSGRLPQIPSARLNNFITDYRSEPVNANTTRAQILEAWMWLKTQPGPNTFAEFRRLKPRLPSRVPRDAKAT